MSFMEKAQGWLGKFTNKPQQGSDPAYTQRADGSTSGYHPNTQRMKPQPAPQPEPVPQWQPEPGYVPPQQMGAAPQEGGKPSWLNTGKQKPVQEQPQMGYTQQQAPQQSYTQQMNYQQPYQAAPQPTGYTQQQPQMGYQQPAPQMQQPMGQEYRGGFAPTWQQPVANVPGSPFEGYVGANQTMNQPAMNGGSAAPNNIVYMNGVTVGQDGTAYRHSMRVAQITTVPDCYRLVAFMRSGESVLVNLDEMNETEEMGRCLDLLYGAAYALQCTFTRVANRCLYLITPADILVQPYEAIAEESDREIDARWPDPASVGYMQRNAQREQDKFGHFTQHNAWGAQPQQPQMNSFGYQGYGAQNAYQQGYQQPAYRQQQFAAGGDPVGFGNRAARAQNTGYTDFGGFGGLGGRR